MNASVVPLLRMSVLQEKVPLSKASIWRKIKDGSFPAPVRIGTNSVAWREDDIAKWQVQCAETLH